ncbi:MAG: sugar-binding domain-containing protein [Phycisphaeraceae bacterium]
MTIPRSEYPRPQCVREPWLCLNGPWQFEIDAGDSGLERGLLERELARQITVPFCPESTLSGIEHTDFMLAVWYRRTVVVPSDWRGRRVLLHFQAVDHDATVWADGREVGRHRGGQTPFACDLGDVGGQTVTLVVRARDDWRPPQARGKQSQQYANHGCHYPRTTGIWQSVWMEPVPEVALARPRLTPDVANSMIRLAQPITSGGAGGPGPHHAGLQLRATLQDAAGVVAQRTVDVLDFTPRLDLPVPAARRRLWSPADPHLYDVSVELLDDQGEILDRITSYAGLRSVTLRGKAVLLNGKPVFQRLVLDQGYYPDGLLTAPSDAALKRDIELAMEAGFNGARLHQKVFEERFLYHADRLGYLLWGEFADWGCNRHGPEGDNQQPTASYITQWLEVLQRDHSHPSIVGWCPLNETRQVLTDRITQLDDVTHGMFQAAKAFDTTRPVLDASGYSHRVPVSDIYDSHDYDQDPASVAQRHAGLADDQPFINKHQGKVESIAYRGQPYFVSEFGGIWWNPDAAADEPSWGYGERPQNLDAFYERFEGLCTTLLAHPQMFAYCYTQLTDVFQEQNGIYTFDRRTKFDLQRLRRIQQQSAAIEAAASLAVESH